MKYLSHLNYINVVARTGSIRKAAEQLNITSTALNRRVIGLEEELGVQIFERLPQGVRLNVAGELLIQHIRQSMADMSKVLSQISDLSGVRRGHVQIAGGSEAIGAFLPSRIALYRQEHSGVSFEILRRAPDAALKALANFECDLALIFGSVPGTEFQTLASVQLDLALAMHPDHPLAKQDDVRMVDCQDFPFIMPAEGSGLETLIQVAQQKHGIKFSTAITSESHEFTSHYLQYEDAISFQLPLGNTNQSQDTNSLVQKPIAKRDKMYGLLHLVQLKGRVLSVAAAKFADQLIQHFNNTYPDSTH